MNSSAKQVKSRYKFRSNLLTNSYQNYNKFRKFKDFLNYLKMKKQFLSRLKPKQRFKFNLNSSLNNRFKVNSNSSMRKRVRSVSSAKRNGVLTHNNRFKLVNKDKEQPTRAASMPDCQFFVEGRCNQESCPYRHIKVGADAKICRHFSRGFCPNGDQCKHKHLFVVRKRDKTKTKSKPKSQKCVKQSIIKSLHNNLSQSENQCLTDHFIPIVSDSHSESINYKSVSNPFVDHKCQQTSEPTLTDQTLVVNTLVNTNRNNNRKDKYIWLESDEEISLDSEEPNVSARRPPIAIVPKFFDLTN